MGVHWTYFSQNAIDRQYGYNESLIDESMSAPKVKNPRTIRVNPSKNWHLAKGELRGRPVKPQETRDKMSIQERVEEKP